MNKPQILHLYMKNTFPLWLCELLSIGYSPTQHFGIFYIRLMRPRPRRFLILLPRLLSRWRCSRRIHLPAQEGELPPSSPSRILDYNWASAHCDADACKCWEKDWHDHLQMNLQKMHHSMDQIAKRQWFTMEKRWLVFASYQGVENMCKEYH